MRTGGSQGMIDKLQEDVTIRAKSIQKWVDFARNTLFFPFFYPIFTGSSNSTAMEKIFGRDSGNPSEMRQQRSSGRQVRRSGLLRSYKEKHRQGKRNQT